ncbi:MAG TPA: trimethylamine methyltransferase family protein, partial [Steroidobacteraceae bacterium]
MSDQSAITRPGRASLRETRRTARSQPAQKLPYIRRRIPDVELLSSEAAEIIERNAELILEEVGIEFRRDPPSLQLWRAAGADVQGERVRIPRGLCRTLLATAPREFT